MTRRVIALVDVRSMFVSCERAFTPHLATRPLVVLSNNDGCVVARSDQAKAHGVRMGQPWYEIMRDPVLSHVVVARSSNYALYADMARRFVALLRDVTDDVEVYSIDECFLSLPADRASELTAEIRLRCWRWLGLPVSVGIGTTKTLAKQAQHHAKATGQWACDISSWPREQIDELLATMPAADVWGVGSRLARRLGVLGIRSAGDLAHADAGTMRRLFSVTVERTTRELAGTPCIPLGQEPTPRQQVLHSRMFGQPVTTRDEMREVLTQYTQQAAIRLRGHQLEASLVTVTMSTSRFRDETWGLTHCVPIVPATSDPALLVHAAHEALPHMREGPAYNRAGVLLSGLTSRESTAALIPHTTRTIDPAILDEVRSRFGKDTVGYGVAGIREARRWTMRREMLSEEVTTHWDQLLLAHT